MDVLAQVIDSKEVADITKITITSPPCVKCAVVLEIMGLSKLVHVPNKKLKNVQSENWPSSERAQLVDIIIPKPPIIAPQERLKYERDIFNTFQVGEWSK